MLIHNIYKSPMYVFDLDILYKRIDFLRYKFKNYGLCYAIKANPFITSALNDFVDRFEVCSPGELEICYNQKVSLSKVVVSGVYKSEEVMEEAIKNHPEIGCYTIESFEQLRLLDRLTKKYNRKINVLIRLSSGNQFGLDEAAIYQIIQEKKLYSFLDIKGIEYYSGTQKTSIKRIQKELTKIDEFIKQLNEELDFMVEELEYGPGYPVSYFENDKDFNDKLYAEEVNSMLMNLNFKGKVILEIGRGIAACCGTYYTKIMDLKSTMNQNYVIVDGGMNHLVYFGQMMAMKQPFFEILPTRNGNIKNYNICGALCSANDIIMKQVEVDLEIGDIICFKNTGAYCMTEGISLFLSRELPEVYIKHNDEMILVRESLKTSNLNNCKEVLIWKN